MAKAVVNNLSKEFPSPKLFTVTVTETLQPDIVGFILATKKKLVCFTVDELNRIFPEQSFLGVSLQHNVGAVAVHRVNPFTPDPELTNMVTKYLSRHDMCAGDKPSLRKLSKGKKVDSATEEEGSSEEDSYEEKERSAKRKKPSPPVGTVPAPAPAPAPAAKRTARVHKTHLVDAKASPKPAKLKRATSSGPSTGDSQSHSGGVETDILQQAVIAADIFSATV